MNNNSRNNVEQAPLRSLNDLVSSRDSRQPMANVTNAPYLMGDADFGDADFGDADFGDIDNQNPAILATYDALIGDVKMGKNTKLALAGGAGLAAGAGLGYGLTRLIDNRKKSQQRTNNSLHRAENQMTITNQINARREMGKIPMNAQFPFFQVKGATLNAAPISATESFVAQVLKINLDRQQTDTPFEVEIVQGTFAGVTWSLSTVGVATNRYYSCVFITVGINTLNGNPGLIFSLTGNMPTINGSLVISTFPFSFTIQPGFFSRICIFPWQIVTNKPLMAMGQYSSAVPITFALTGLPSNASVSMTVPGSQHTWTIGMRNRLM